MHDSLPPTQYDQAIKQQPLMQLRAHQMHHVTTTCSESYTYKEINKQSGSTRDRQHKHLPCARPHGTAHDTQSQSTPHGHLCATSEDKVGSSSHAMPSGRALLLIQTHMCAVSRDQGSQQCFNRQTCRKATNRHVCSRCRHGTYRLASGTAHLLQQGV